MKSMSAKNETTRDGISAVLQRLLAIAMVGGLFMALSYAPPMMGPDGVPLGEAFRIFYFHVPAAWTASLLFLASFIASIGYLSTRNPRWDFAGGACAEVGWVMSTIVLTTGPIWGRAAWGHYWTWEPRLTSFLILWLMYGGYLVLRNSIDDPGKRARYSSVLSIVSFINVPIVFLAIKMWGSIGHPKSGGGFFSDPNIRNALLANVIVYLFAAIYLVRRKMEVQSHVE